LAAATNNFAKKLELASAGEQRRIRTHRDRLRRARQSFAEQSPSGSFIGDPEQRLVATGADAAVARNRIHRA
jgi:hypothetical protein